MAVLVEVDLGVVWREHAVGGSDDWAGGHGCVCVCACVFVWERGILYACWCVGVRVRVSCAGEWCVGSEGSARARSGVQLLFDGCWRVCLVSSCRGYPRFMVQSGTLWLFSQR